MVTAAALLLAACGNGNGNDAGGADQDATGGGDVDGELAPVTIHANSVNTYQVNFNPFSAAALHGTRGFIYEPLIATTPMADEPIPWLADEMEFNDDGTQVTFSLREGVTWSDGEEFNAEDVAYTFNTMAEHPATNPAALDIVDATSVDDHTVEVTFDSTMFAFGPAIGNVVIVPEHIFGNEDPVEFTNDEPVGTGPFVLGTFDQQLYTFVSNPEYRDSEEIMVEELRFPANTEQTFTTSLQAGEIDWSGGFVSNIDTLFVSGDPENRGYWFPGGGLVNVIVNLENAPFDDLAVREALSLAMDREQITQVAMEGYTPPAHPTGLPQPAYESALSPEYADASFSRDVEEANRILDVAGYEMGDDGVRTTPDGERMSYSLPVPSSWVDWVTVVGLLEEQFAEIGIDIEPQGISFEAWVEDRNNGSFDITMASVAIGQSPFDMFRSIMSSEYLGDDSVAANFSRYSNEAADEALSSYANTEDPAEQQAALDVLQELVVEELPVIPIFPAPNWYQYNTANWEGFPNEDDPYAFGAPFQFPDTMLVVHNLTPAN